MVFFFAMIDSYKIIGKVMRMLYNNEGLNRFYLKGGMSACFFGVWPYLNI